ncbi:MAG: transcriptional repressor [Desulfatibacillum sp.]|nr:transcriptional repressor [Desulfatibacillum sp.]
MTNTIPEKQQFRMTRQRKVILEELKKVKSHPTADQVYEMVRKRLPRISLATVYRNLETLSTAGEVLKLEISGTQRRYDGDTSDHHHARCAMCGAVMDIPADLFPMPEIPEDVVEGFDISGYRLELTGLCRECRAAKAA